MSKTILLVLIIATVAFAQSHARGSFTSGKAGAFHQNDQTQLQALKNNEQFKRAEFVARQFWTNTKGETLGEVIKVQHQMVSGVNYKITFAKQDSQLSITVWVQPWTSTVKVTRVEPAVQGVTDTDGNLLIAQN